jgi:hypothetical protein
MEKTIDFSGKVFFKKNGFPGACFLRSGFLTGRFCTKKNQYLSFQLPFLCLEKSLTMFCFISGNMDGTYEEEIYNTVCFKWI